VYCWGANDAGQLGVGHTRYVDEVVRVPGIERAADIDVGGSASCAALADGRLVCWGAMFEPLWDRNSRPLAFPGVNDTVTVAVGNQGLCVVNAKGEARCRVLDHLLSTLWSSGVRQTVELTGSTRHARCALMQDGSASCTGDFPPPDDTLPQLLSGLRDLRRLALGEHHGCAIRTDGKVVCVGSDSSGQLGTGRLLASTTPILVE
jgi:alpha-tubulin suppressor-like RCC1 family protein